MNNYLCEKCRSNTCFHVDLRLQQQMLDRYMRDYGMRNNQEIFDINAFHVSLNQIRADAYEEIRILKKNSIIENKKLLLLRRKK